MSDVEWFRLREPLRLQPSVAVSRTIEPGLWARAALAARLTPEQLDALVRLQILEPLS